MHILIIIIIIIIIKIIIIIMVTCKNVFDISYFCISNFKALKCGAYWRKALNSK